jgi:GMP synthase (glutamine-hydrolysing)
VAGVYRHATGAGLSSNGRPRTKTRVTGRSCSTHSGPMVSVSQPGTVHCVTIGMRTRYPLGHSSNLPARSRVAPVLVLSVTHGPTVPGGVFDEAVADGGHVLERWQVPEGGSPGAATDFDAVLVFGGSQHPDEDDRFSWLGREEQFLQDVLAARVPVLGVCLGAQMLARAAGASVRPAREPEIGWHDVSLTQSGAADPVLGVLPARATVFQWHHYTFGLPPGATALAESDVCLQAYALRERPAWGIQFHAEVTAEMLSAWIEEDPADLPMPPETLRAESETQLPRSNAQGRALASAFLREAEAHRRGALSPSAAQGTPAAPR